MYSYEDLTIAFIHRTMDDPLDVAYKKKLNIHYRSKNS